MHTTNPHSGSRVAPGAPLRPGYPRRGPTLEEALRDALRVARPEDRVVGSRLPQEVRDACKTGRALLTRTLTRALEALVDNPRIPDAPLLNLGAAFERWVRRRRGIPAPDLATAMRAEQATNAALDPAQWCVAGALTLGDVHTMRDLAIRQRRATEDLVAACDAEIARRTTPAATRAG